MSVLSHHVMHAIKIIFRSFLGLLLLALAVKTTSVIPLLSAGSLGTQSGLDGRTKLIDRLCEVKRSS